MVTKVNKKRSPCLTDNSICVMLVSFSRANDKRKEDRMTAADVFSDNVKLFRTRLKMSQDELAEKSGVSRTIISQIENKKFDIESMRHGTIKSLADALGVPYGELIGEDTYEFIKEKTAKSAINAIKNSLQVDLKKIFT